MDITRRRRPAAVDIVASVPVAGVMRAALVDDVDHAVPSMTLAVDRISAAVDIVARYLYARVV